MRFVDTSFWIALAVTRDASHEQARLIWGGPAGRLLTSNHVLGETWTYLRRKVGFPGAIKMLDSISASKRVEIEHVDRATESQAWGWLRRRDERSYSFVDATSFALMRRMRLREALAFDGDFSAAGFVEIRV